MAKKKAVKLTMKDTVARWTFAFSALLGVGVLVPYTPWRRMSQTPVFHSRFSQHRQMSLLSMTDKDMSYQPFSKWKREACTLRRNYATPDLLSGLASSAASIFSQKSGFSAATTMGCKMWSICRDHVSQRCTAYNTLMLLGIGVMVGLILSVLFSIAVPVLISTDTAMKANSKKQKAAKEAAEYSTMVVGILGFLFSSASLVVYWMSSESAFKSLQSTAYYPFPAAFIGMWICDFMVFCQFIGMICVVLRVYSKPADSDDSDEDKGEGSGSD